MALRCPTAQRGILPHSVAFSKPSAHPPAVRGCSCDAQQYCSTQRKARKVSVASSQWGDHNQEMLIGDNVALVTFCLYKQILALILSPTFPGWTAPLSFNVTNFEEFLGMVVTVTCTWTISSYLSADYERTTTSDLRATMVHTCRTWLITMPVIGAQLVLATAAESGSLIGTDGWDEVLPLAASGIGEPFVSAAGILGVMTIWRTCYVAFFDWGAFLSFRGGDSQQEQARAFIDSVVLVLGFVILSTVGFSLTSWAGGGQLGAPM